MSSCVERHTVVRLNRPGFWDRWYRRGAECTSTEQAGEKVMEGGVGRSTEPLQGVQLQPKRTGHAVVACRPG